MSSEKITNWGSYPEVEGSIHEFSSYDELGTYVRSHQDFIGRGNGRSYGDASLNTDMISLKNLNQVLNLDENNALITCQCGVLLSEILEVIVPKGLFLPVTPGTKQITLGGAIAADVHGKNHFNDGSLAKYLRNIKIIVADGSMIECSPDQHDTLFWNTCGGMGLTGLVVEATIELTRIETAYVQQESTRFVGLTEMMTQFETYKDKKYQIAWLDTINGIDTHRVKGVFSSAGHCTVRQIEEKGAISHPLKVPQHRGIEIPRFFPSWLINVMSMSLYNRWYTFKATRHSSQICDYDTFFYPLDSLINWNRMYGKKGLVQYQFVVPEQHLKELWDEFVLLMGKYRRYSYLSVVKRFGPGNTQSPLSFPKEGYCLALDFKRDRQVLGMMDEMDKVLVRFEGKTYLAKDARMSAKTFKKGYDLSGSLLAETAGKFQSLQSKRLEITG